MRRVYYSILVNKFEKETADDQPIVIREYLRFKKEIKIYDVELTDRFQYTDNRLLAADFIFKECLAMSDNKHRRLLSDKQLNGVLRGLFAVLNFWKECSGCDGKRESDLFRIKKSKNCKRAFIVSLIKCSIIDVCYQKFADTPKQQQQQGLLTDLITNVDPQKHEFLSDTKYLASDEFTDNLNKFILAEPGHNDYIKAVYSKLNTFCPSFTINHSQVKRTGAHKLAALFNLKLIHCLCEFQAIYFSLSYVVEGLRAFGESELNYKSSFSLPCLDKFYNGAFLHGFICELESRTNPDLYVEEVLGRKSLLRHIYVRLASSFDEVFGGEEADSLEAGLNKLKI